MFLSTVYGLSVIFYCRAVLSGKNMSGADWVTTIFVGILAIANIIMFGESIGILVTSDAVHDPNDWIILLFVNVSVFAFCLLDMWNRAQLGYYKSVARKLAEFTWMGTLTLGAIIAFVHALGWTLNI